jgi:hypothetical protein
MLAVLPEPSRTVVAVAAFTGLRAGEVRGLEWEAYKPGEANSLGVIRVLRSIWRNRIGEPKNSRSKAPVPLIPQLEAILERHREASGGFNRGSDFSEQKWEGSRSRQPIPPPDERTSDSGGHRLGRLAWISARPRHKPRTHRR